jgi:predicted transposase YdaD
VTRPWQAVVVFPDRSADTGIITPYQGLIGCGLLRRVYLSDLLDAEPLGFNARLARLVVLDPTETPTEARALASERSGTADPLETLDLIETILVYKFPRLTREEIRAMLHLPISDLKKTRFYQEVFSEGREEGREEGRGEGRDEGREEGERDLILRQLARRCGTPSVAQQARIRALSGNQLGALGEALLEFRSLEDLERWLAAR